MKAHLIALACCLSLPALAGSEHPLLAGYAAQARQQDSNFNGFSTERGKALLFFRSGAAFETAEAWPNLRPGYSR